MLVVNCSGEAPFCFLPSTNGSGYPGGYPFPYGLEVRRPALHFQDIDFPGVPTGRCHGNRNRVSNGWIEHFRLRSERGWTQARDIPSSTETNPPRLRPALFDPSRTCQSAKCRLKRERSGRSRSFQDFVVRSVQNEKDRPTLATFLSIAGKSLCLSMSPT